MPPGVVLTVLLAAAAAAKNLVPVAVNVHGTLTTSYKVLDGRTLYLPSAKRPGEFEAAETRQGFQMRSTGTGILRGEYDSDERPNIVEDDDVAGKDFPGHDRIRITPDGKGGARLDVDFLMEERDGSDTSRTATRYSVPLKPLGDGWILAVRDAGPHYDAWARAQAQSNRAHTVADGWRVTELKATYEPPEGDEALRLVREGQGWRLLQKTPYTLKVFMGQAR